MESNEAYKQRVVGSAKERGDLITVEDGFMYFWPHGRYGMMSAADLRILADHLDEQNKAMQQSIEEYFAAHPEGQEATEASAV